MRWADPGVRRPWSDRRVLLGVTGGIAAYKAVHLARELTLRGAQVDTLLTEAAHEFVRPLTFEAVTGRRVLSDPFAVEGSALHLRLAREADAVCVAPATADLIARAAQGRAEGLLTSVLLATRAPVLLCPAMNDRMYGHPRTRANLELLEGELGYRMVGPVVGRLAHGEGEGPGRMMEPEAIVEHVGRALAEEASFRDRKVLVTAGPTREPFDPVRFVGNRSSGRMGYAVALAAWRRGARVRLVSGPTALSHPPGVEVIEVERAEEMYEAVREGIGQADLSVFAAAVSDYRPEEALEEKLKRSGSGNRIELRLVGTRDVAAETRSLRKEGGVSVGFALETECLVENARAKLEKKGFDLLVANAVGEEGAGFGVETNRVTILDRKGGEEPLPLLSKEEVAERILDRVRDRLWGGD